MSLEKHSIAIVLGTRPEIIKLAPLMRECERRGLQYATIHTGQHYSQSLDTVFFDRLELPPPDRNLGIGSGRHGEQTGEMIAGIERVLLEGEFETVLVQGDTNSTLAGAIAASKLDLSVGHVEAGLRSYDRKMPEEINRILTDHVADHLFCPTEDAAKTLRREGIPSERIFVTGNTIVDAVERNLELAERESSTLANLGLVPYSYALVTAHRPENVDDPDRFADLLCGVDLVARALDVEAIYPIHPRAAETIERSELSVPESIRLIDPLDYFDFLSLEHNARLVLTDSGGVQEEACVLGVPCVTMRDSTERPETVAVDANRLVGTDPDAILAGAHEMIARSGEWENPFGDGDAAPRILDALTVRPTAEVTG